jgi:exodeoxyribonuclease VII large subunit
MRNLLSRTYDDADLETQAELMSDARLPGMMPPTKDEATFSVGELNQAVAGALVDAFPRAVWVRGEIQQFRRSTNGHTYFQLVEKDGNRDNVRAALSVALFKAERGAVNRSLRETPGIKITDGVEVRIRGRIDYYPPAGRLQFLMNAIDPVFSVGKMAADRERVVRVLASEGVLRRNATQELAALPLRVGLLTSGGSAAYHDFLHELEVSRHPFQITHVDVRVQGAGSWRRIAFGLRRLAELELDVVVLIRGGGARSDLAAFDAEAVARAITEMPMPVITGIGHEVDRTVADEVAHTSAKTPTAAAAVLVGAVDSARERLARVAHRLALRARGACALADRRLDEQRRTIRRRVPAVVAREDQRLTGYRRRVGEMGRRATHSAGRRVGTAEARLRALDPRRVLERGYSITRQGDGRVLRSAALVAPGDVLLTEMADGALRSRAETVDLIPPEVGTAS